MYFLIKFKLLYVVYFIFVFLIYFCIFALKHKMQINNKKAYHEYYILEEYIAGIKLVGSEVKSLRNGTAHITDGYIVIDKNEIYARGIYIAKYNESTYMNHEEVHDRKLLLNRKEIKDLQKQLKISGITIVPLSLFIMNGKFKLKIGVA